jgi:oligoendopeptidase F
METMPGSEAGSKPSETELPLWDLGPIFPSLESGEYAAATSRMASLSTEFLARLASAPPASGSPAPGSLDELGAWLAAALELEEACGSLYETLSAYAYAIFSTDTGNARAVAELNAVEELGLPLKRAKVLFRNALAARRSGVEALLGALPGALQDRARPPEEGAAPRPEAEAPGASVARLAFHLREELFWQSKQMSPELEELAADLQRSGGDAWGRLQESITSSASAPWNSAEGMRETTAASGRKTLVELRNLAYDGDRSVRERAYRLELELCESLKVPGAAALNGVKGFAVSLNARRGWEASLDKSAAQARVSREALDALILAMEESLPSWRRYLKAKAALLGIGRCAFYDLFAPLGRAPLAAPGVEPSPRSFSFGEARDFIVEKLSSFDPGMGSFASRAFSSSWIDARPRPGKVGGAYCIDFPAAGTARVLCNFDGSFNSVMTLAHELGHAWHAELVRGLPYAYTQYPMTLAETASIFSETLVFEGSLKSAGPAERGYLLELHLQDACQVIVDILSRFYFERAVFERRATAELSPGELCELMLEAQKRSYGEGLDPERLHPYMWLVKGHYYSTDLAFYNFPYAFGQLFGAALYSRYEAEGPGFAGSYRRILENTGRMSSAELAATAGFDIRKPDFWREGLGLFARQAAELEAIAARAPGIFA